MFRDLKGETLDGNPNISTLSPNPLRGQQMIQQRRLPGPEEAGEDRQRDTVVGIDPDRVSRHPVRCRDDPQQKALPAALVPGAGNGRGDSIPRRPQHDGGGVLGAHATGVLA